MNRPGRSGWRCLRHGAAVQHGERIPVLVLHGAGVDPGMLADYPRASVAVLDGAGHALPLEQPDLLAGLLRYWLTRFERAS